MIRKLLKTKLIIFLSKIKRKKSYITAFKIVLLFELITMLFGSLLYINQEKQIRYFTSYKNKLTFNNKNKYDLLILGDSVGLRAVNPLILEKNFNLSSFNFSLSEAHSIFASYLFLKNYLLHCKDKPKYLILSFSESTLAIKKKKIEKEMISFFSDIKYKNLNEIYDEFGLIFMIKMFLPSIKHRLFYKEFFKSPFRGLKLIKKNSMFNPDSFTKTICDNKGFMSSEKKMIIDDKLINNIIFNIKSFSQTDLLSPFSEKILDKIIKIASIEKLQIIVLKTVYPAVNTDLFPDEVKKKITNLRLKIQKKYNNIYFYEPEINCYDNMFADSIHFNKEGADIYTKQLGDFIIAQT